MSLRGGPRSLRGPTKEVRAKRRAADRVEMVMQNKGVEMAAKSEQPDGTENGFQMEQSLELRPAMTISNTVV